MPCCSDDACASSVAATGRYRAILWIVLAINAVMFLVAISAGLAAGSAALQADALDFFADDPGSDALVTVTGTCHACVACPHLKPLSFMDAFTGIAVMKHRRGLNS